MDRASSSSPRARRVGTGPRRATSRPRSLSIRRARACATELADVLFERLLRAEQRSRPCPRRGARRAARRLRRRPLPRGARCRRARRARGGPRGGARVARACRRAAPRPPAAIADPAAGARRVRRRGSGARDGAVARADDAWTTPAGCGSSCPRPRPSPANMLYVPPGRFLFGSADSSDLRRGFLNAPPVHEVSTGAYLIGQLRGHARRVDRVSRRASGRGAPAPHAELDDHAVRARARRSSRRSGGVSRSRRRRRPTSRRPGSAFTTRVGRFAPIRTGLRFPVAAISFEDAIAYTTWLDRTQRHPRRAGCATEHEWERAARGADARTFPSGATLAPDDANIDVTYGREPLAFGPDEVGVASQPRAVRSAPTIWPAMSGSGRVR